MVTTYPYDDATYYLGGYLSELRFWSQARTSSEISDAFATPLSGTESSLEAYWPLDDGSGSAVADATGAGADGSLENGPVWESSEDLCWEDTSALVCLIETESTDADGDAITYTFDWEVDGAAYSDATTTVETGDTVPAEDIELGELWTCFVTPDDGDDDGDEAEATLTVEPPCDADGDGYESEDCGGLDCDEDDGSVYPYAGDTYGDGVDSDCDDLDCEASTDGTTYFAVCIADVAAPFSATATYCTDGGHDGLTSIRDASEQALASAA